MAVEVATVPASLYSDDMSVSSAIRKFGPRHLAAVKFHLMARWQGGHEP
jgi:hypothetical protein